MLNRSLEMRLVYQELTGNLDSVREAHASWKYEETLEHMVTRYQEQYGLAWSPDQSRLYWCPGRYLAGAVISLADQSYIEHAPCFVLPSWSPDGKRIVGVAESKIQVWEVPTAD